MSDDFWSWFGVMMRDELAVARGKKHADARRDSILRNWLVYAPAAGNC